VPVEATVDVACSAEQCWRLLADVLRVPEWVPGVAAAEVVEADADGRPLVVRFIGMPAAGSLDYVLRYGHDDQLRTLRWRSQDDAGERHLEGEARVVDLGDGRCRLHYVLTSWNARSLPGWAQATLADDTPERTAGAFRRWAERNR